MNEIVRIKPPTPPSLSFRQLFTTPIGLRENVDLARSQRADRLLRRVEARLTYLERRQRRLARVVRLDARGEPPGIDRLNELAAVCKERAQLSALLPLGTGSVRVVVAASLLAESFAYCTQDGSEGLHYVIGIEHEGQRIGTHIRTFPYAHRSPVAAEGNHDATHRIAIQTQERGECIVLMLHSHPGRGPRANEPSGTDMRTQALIQRTSRCIGGIWSRDGHLRFYSHELNFDVTTIGPHLEKTSDECFRLLSTASDANLSDAPVAGSRDRSAGADRGLEPGWPAIG